MRVFVEGNLGNDANYITNGDTQRLELFLLENRTRQNKETGERETMGTAAHNVVLFGKRAEMWQGIFKKGMRVTVSGEQQPTDFLNAERQQHTSLSIVADSIGVVPFGVDIAVSKNQLKGDDDGQPF